MPRKPDGASHHWEFFRAGGVDQVRLDRGSDLGRLRRLDQKLWVALSCPVKGLEFDERTLALLDADGDGRVRARELIEAGEWACGLLKNADDLALSKEGLALASIDASTPEGKRIFASAKHVLASLGRPEAPEITVAEAMNTAEVFAKARHNGDGVVPPDFIDDEGARGTAADILACFGGEGDRSGKQGITKARLDALAADARASSEWWARAEKEGATVLPLGDATPAAFDALRAVRPKVDDFFARCRLAAYDARALQALNREETAYLAVAAKDLSIGSAEIAGFPISQIAPGKALPLVEGVNPAWCDALAALRDLAVGPVLGRDRAELTEADWSALKARFAAHERWRTERTGVTVEKLGLPRVREILSGVTLDPLAREIERDLAVAPQVDAMASVERLARYARDLFRLARNYVSFIDFFARTGATFQAGTLYLDGRACSLCVKVLDAGKHGTIAVMAKAFLAYVDCTRPGSERMTVACAFTAGDSDNLFVGRNGIFYDRKGRDWDATITKIIDNPISVRQAFWSPYKKLLRFIETQAAKRAAAADEASTAKLQGVATAAGEAAESGKAPAQKPKFDVGVIAALGVAVGGIAAATTALLNKFFDLGIWMPVGVLGFLLLISGPSMLIAWMKLRQRNIGPILDANGWAVNALVKVIIPLGTALTERAKLPPGAGRTLKDPYAPKKSIGPRILFLLLLLGGAGYGLYRYGYLHKWLPKYFADPRAKREAPLEPAPPPAIPPGGG